MHNQFDMKVLPCSSKNNNSIFMIKNHEFLSEELHSKEEAKKKETHNLI
jgi:hypothetical protein